MSFVVTVEVGANTIGKTVVKMGNFSVAGRMLEERQMVLSSESVDG